MCIKKIDELLIDGLTRCNFLWRIRCKQGSDRPNLSIVEASNSLISAVRSFTPSHKAIYRPAVINAFGNTYNNRQEFQTLEKFFRHSGISAPFINIKDSVQIPLSTLFDTKNLELIKNKCISILESNLHQNLWPVYDPLWSEYAVVFIRNFVYFYVSMGSKTLARSIPFCLVANDHNPDAIAFIQVAKLFDIPTVYMQHAAVTEHFPPLNFDVSILKDQASKLIYQKIFEVNQKIHILPRRDADVDVPSIPRVKYISVGLYLTANFNELETRKVIELLVQNRFIEKIYIVLHPRTKQHFFIKELLSSKVEVNNKEQISPDIAVVQNSSVCIELLQSGTPVFQIFGADNSPTDYYGFVARGITFEVKWANLTERFWTEISYETDWVKNFKDFSPPRLSKEDKKLLQRDISMLVEKSNSPRVLEVCKYQRNANFIVKEGFLELGRHRMNNPLDQEQFCFAVYNFPRKLVSYFVTRWEKSTSRVSVDTQRLMKTSPAIERGSESNLSDSLFYISTLSKISSDKDSRFRNFLNVALQAKSNCPVVIWCKIRCLLLSWEGLKTIDPFLFLDENWKDQLTPKVYSVLLVRFVEALIARRDIDSLAIIKAPLISHLDKLSVNSLVSLELLFFKLNTQNDKAGINKAVPEVAGSLGKNLHGYNKFKFDLLTGRELCFQKNYSQSENVIKFASMVNSEALSNEIKEWILPPYRSFESRLQLMDVRFSIDQQQYIFQKISTHLRDSRPLSFVRLSDGEGYLFQGMSRFFQAEQVANRERHWWGRELAEFARQEVCEIGLKAVKSADIVGIPCVYRFVRDVGDNTKSLLDAGGGVTGRGLLSVLAGVSTFLKSDAILTDEKANDYLFYSRDRIATLCAQAKKVLIVSSVRSEGLSWFAKLGVPVDHVVVPTHHATFDNPRFVQSGTILPNVLNVKLAEVRVLAGPGVLGLVAAGVAGKGFIHEIAKEGGVAIDVGHALNYLVD